MDSFRVYTRCRPLNQQQQQTGYSRKSVTIIDSTTLSISPNDGSSKQHIFQLDGVYDEHACNIEIFESAIRPVIGNFVNGINSTVFAYGITGAGKSFTMFGKAPNPNLETKACDEMSGIIPLTFQYLLNTNAQQSQNPPKLKLSYLQIYNEQVYDLLSSTQSNLQVSQDPIQGVIVQDLKQVELESYQQAEEMIAIGNSRRVIAETKANQVSSRSHAIVIIYMERIEGQRCFWSKLSLVDLAGSERQSVHSETRGIRTFQGSNINRSLLTLGNCINILSQKRKQNSTSTSQPQFIPYRDSKLTRLLKDSLGGNTKTVMIACISSSSLCYQQTLNTLKYACRANKIEKVVHQNIRQTKNAGAEQYRKQIANLKKQNQLLKMNLNISLMMPGLNIGIIQQENVMKRNKVKDMLAKLTKLIEDRVEIMMSEDREEQQKIEAIEKFVNQEEQIKAAVLEQFQIKTTRNMGDRHKPQRKASKKQSIMILDGQYDNVSKKQGKKQKSLTAYSKHTPSLNSNINQISQIVDRSRHPPRHQRKLTDSMTLEPGFNNNNFGQDRTKDRMGNDKKGGKRVSNSVKKLNNNNINKNGNGVTTHMNSSINSKQNNYSKYKLLLSQEHRIGAKFVQQIPITIPVGPTQLNCFFQEKQKQFPVVAKPVINLQNLRKKVMQDKKQLQNFKKQIDMNLLTREQILYRANSLLQMGQLSTLRFSEDQKEYLLGLVHGPSHNTHSKLNGRQSSEKKDLLASSALGKNILCQPNQLIQKFLQKTTTENNSRNRHLKSLNRIISMARFKNNKKYLQSQGQNALNQNYRNKHKQNLPSHADDAVHMNISYQSFKNVYKNRQKNREFSQNTDGQANAVVQNKLRNNRSMIHTQDNQQNIYSQAQMEPYFQGQPVHSLSCINLHNNSMRNFPSYRQSKGSTQTNLYPINSGNSYDNSHNVSYQFHMGQVETINNSYELDDDCGSSSNRNHNVYDDGNRHKNISNRILGTFQQEYYPNMEKNTNECHYEQWRSYNQEGNQYGNQQYGNNYSHQNSQLQYFQQ